MQLTGGVSAALAGTLRSGSEPSFRSTLDAEAAQASVDLKTSTDEPTLADVTRAILTLKNGRAAGPYLNAPSILSPEPFIHSLSVEVRTYPRRLEMAS